MVLQRMCLAISLAVSGAFLAQAACAQGTDPGTGPGGAPASDANAASPAPVDQAPADQAPVAKIDHSEHVPANPKGPKVIINVDLSTQHMHVQFPDGTEADWPVASGRPGLDTPDGNYKPQWVDPDHVSKEYQDAPMPYAIFFDLKGHAIHGSYEKTFGRAVSHGCVRLPVQDAKRLFEAVKVSGAEIEIAGRAPRNGHQLTAERQRQRAAEAQRRYAEEQGGNGGYYGGYQQSYGSPYPPYPGQRGYYRQPPQQSFFGGLFGGN